MARKRDTSLAETALGGAAIGGGLGLASAAARTPDTSVRIKRTSRRRARVTINVLGKSGRIQRAGLVAGGLTLAGYSVYRLLAASERARLASVEQSRRAASIRRAGGGMGAAG